MNSVTNVEKKELVKPNKNINLDIVSLYVGEGCTVGNGCSETGMNCDVGNNCNTGANC